MLSKNRLIMLHLPRRIGMFYLKIEIYVDSLVFLCVISILGVYFNCDTK